MVGRRIARSPLGNLDDNELDELQLVASPEEVSERLQGFKPSKTLDFKAWTMHVIGYTTRNQLWSRMQQSL